MNLNSLKLKIDLCIFIYDIHYILSKNSIIALSTFVSAATLPAKFNAVSISN